ncbi:uncharacterized protein EV422DRAFT_548291 [Fimicolochytrium jonesii]|uniref:uncharacterized protein n=1 Tax=Fimicolochytrium jonesii TaxID=1396493 RepID=UPI0022FDB325|nr:uncharacterized protein EV422DRAFT_548291 [Fimicolochytrium jonesii]KAI8815760.1 hypothetical protein EV422DRAFT_548291 [Fimicolochytrium jonesii]
MEEGREANVAELAQESRHTETKKLFPGVPLTILAPVLVALALIGVILPNTYILQNASQDSTQDVTNKYLSSLLSNVRYQVETVVNPLKPVATILAGIPASTNWLLSAQKDNYTNLEAFAETISTYGATKAALSLDGVVCLRASWRAGYENLGLGIRDVNKTTVNLGIIQLIVPPGYPDTVAAITDNDTPFQQRGIVVDQTTWLPKVPLPNGTFPLTIPSSVYINLGLVPTTSFIVYKDSVTKQQISYAVKSVFLNPTDKTPAYTCAAGIKTATSWNTALLKARPTEDSVLTLFDPQFNILASTGMVMNATASSTTYDTAYPNEDALAFQTFIKSKYTLAGAVAAGKAQTTFEVEIAGTHYIVGIDLAGAQTYPSYPLLLVAAIPREKIYGKIEAAKKRSTGVVIGIAIAVTAFVAAVFIVVALPLLTLAREMEKLTKLDFGSLEASGSLERRSLIWELSKVQTTFATMVKAFAGAIKKNRALVNKSAQNGGAVSSTRSGVNASTKNLPGAGGTINASTKHMIMGPPSPTTKNPSGGF